MSEESPQNDHQKLEALLAANLELAKENNQLLRIMKRNNTIGLVLQITWYAVLIGVPVILYWYLLDPIVNSNSGFLDAVSEAYNIP